MEYKSNKDEIFNSIYQTYADEIYRVGLHYTRDEHMAQEITQRAFYQLYFHIENVNMDSVRAYLIRTARNLAFNEIRDTKREVLKESFEILEEQSVTIAGLEEIYMRKEEKAQAKTLSNSILERLRMENEAWYEAVMLVYCLEIPQEQAAKQLHIRKDVLYSRLYRARKWVRKNYGKEYADFVRGL